MIDFIIAYLSKFSFYYLFLITLSFFLITNQWSNIKRIANIKNYIGKQRIHEKEVPRMGGFIIFAFFFLYIFHNSFHSSDSASINFVFIACCSVPIFLIGFYEDICQDSTPTIRLLVMFVSVAITLFYSGFQLPAITFPVLGNLISNSIFIYPFYILSVVIFMNGVNMIDGSNGLMSFCALTQLIALIFLSSVVGDYFVAELCVLLACPLVIFIFFNYPFGKIFMGDLGAYLYGFYIALITIILFGRNPELPSWGAVLVLFYPLMEIFFSYYRKIFFEKTSPIHPDSFHIHLKMYRLLSLGIKRKKVANGLVMPTLAILWLSPCVLVIFFHNSLLGIFFSLLLLVISYLGFYWALPRK